MLTRLHAKAVLQTPWSRDGFIQLLEQVEDEAEQVEGGREERPVLVHCMDGASQSGLYCACAVICEIIRQEEEVDIFHVVKHIKRRRPQCVNSLVCSICICLSLLLWFISTLAGLPLWAGNHERS